MLSAVFCHTAQDRVLLALSPEESNPLTSASVKDLMTQGGYPDLFGRYATMNGDLPVRDYLRAIECLPENDNPDPDDPEELVPTDIATGLFFFNPLNGGYESLDDTILLPRWMRTLIAQNRPAHEQKQFELFKKDYLSRAERRLALLLTDKPGEEQHLYFMRNPFTGHIKVGIAKDIDKRCQQITRKRINELREHIDMLDQFIDLQSRQYPLFADQPEEFKMLSDSSDKRVLYQAELDMLEKDGIEILTHMPFGGRRYEKILHRLLDQFRLYGEWFTPNHNLTQIIDDVKTNGYITRLPHPCAVSYREKPSPR